MERREKQLVDEINQYSDKSKKIIIALWILNLHYFYLGRPLRGIVCALTGNFFGLGFIADGIYLVTGKLKDSQGRPVNIPRRMAAEISLQEYYRTQKKRK